MSKEQIALGKLGEAIASKFLKKKGYIIFEKNFSSPLGEIDIIAQDKDVLCFIEVKTRHSTAFGLPEEGVTGKKKKRLVRIAQFYLKGCGKLNANCRFDVVSVLIDKTTKKPKIQLIQDAF
jgi:putative endonuclease